MKGEKMKQKKTDFKSSRTDLIIEQKITTIAHKTIEENQLLKVIQGEEKSSVSTTIFFKDITDHNHFKLVQHTFIKYLKQYIKINRQDTILVIGLGNSKSTPDALGPTTIDNILVTRYLFLLGEVEEGYSNVCSFTPNVMGNTGIETANIIKSIIKETKATKVIVIDALKTNDLSHLLKTIQITNKGISPGSGIQNNRKEISKKTVGVDIIAIGVPTVVDINCLIQTKENLIVTPTDIDFIIDKLSILIGNGINMVLHKKFDKKGD